MKTTTTKAEWKIHLQSLMEDTIMAGTWQPLVYQPPFGASTMLLLTDGTVFCQENASANWWRLTPDQFGNYVNGTWTPLSSMKNSQTYHRVEAKHHNRIKECRRTGER